MFYLFAMYGTPLRRLIYAESEEKAKLQTDPSVWQLIDILPPEKVAVTYLAAENYYLTPQMN